MAARGRPRGRPRGGGRGRPTQPRPRPLPQSSVNPTTIGHDSSAPAARKANPCSPPPLTTSQDVDNAYAGFDALLALGRIPGARDRDGHLARSPSVPEDVEDVEAAALQDAALQAAVAAIEKADGSTKEDKSEGDGEEIATARYVKKVKKRTALEKRKKASRRMEGDASDEDDEKDEGEEEGGEQENGGVKFGKKVKSRAGKQDSRASAVLERCNKAGGRMEAESKSLDADSDSKEEIVTARYAKKATRRVAERDFRRDDKGSRRRRTGGRSEKWNRKRFSCSDDDEDEEDEEYEEEKRKSKRRMGRRSIDDEDDDSYEDDEEEDERRWRRLKEKKKMQRRKHRILDDCSDYEDEEDARKRKRAVKRYRGSVDDGDEEKDERLRRFKRMKMKRRHWSLDDEEEEADRSYTRSRKGTKMRKHYWRRDDSDAGTDDISDRHRRHKRRNRMIDTSGSESYSSDELSDDSKRSDIAPKVAKQMVSTHELKRKGSRLRSRLQMESGKDRSERMVRVDKGMCRHAVGPTSHDLSPQQHSQLENKQFRQQLSFKSHGRSLKSQAPPQVDQQMPQGQQLRPSTVLTATRRTRGSRGPTQCLKIWNLPENERLSISFDGMGEPIGSNASDLVTFLGTVARKEDIAPLTYSGWKAMPDVFKENMWEMVKSKFDIEESRKGWIMISLGKRWRGYKSNLKKDYFDPLETFEERLANIPERIHDHDQWRALVEFWSTEEWKAQSARNKANRAKSTMRHTSGRKSFAQIREEERAKKPNMELPSRAEVFIVTHTRKDGQPVDEPSGAVIAHLKELSEQVESSQDCNPSDDILSKVLGKKRHGSKLSRREIMHAHKAAEEEVRILKEKVQDLEQKYTSAEERRAAAEEINSINNLRMTSMEQTMTMLLSTIQTHFPGFDMPIPLGTGQVSNSDR